MSQSGVLDLLSKHKRRWFGVGCLFDLGVSVSMPNLYNTLRKLRRCGLVEQRFVKNFKTGRDYFEYKHKG
jgi:DNA-binding transcriptional ArsR family regulator